MAETQSLLQNCLYFTANTLSRAIGRLADEAFAPLGLAPSAAFALMLVAEQPGISQKELARHLALAPSTVTRLVDGLVRKELVQREQQGKLALIRPTTQGAERLPEIRTAWKRLYRLYVDVLGEAEARELTDRLHGAGCRLEPSEPVEPNAND